MHFIQFVTDTEIQEVAAGVSLWYSRYVVLLEVSVARARNKIMREHCIRTCSLISMPVYQTEVGKLKSYYLKNKCEKCRFKSKECFVN